MLRGIDISSYQRFTNYELLNQAKLAFVYIKATEGIYKDQQFTTHQDGFSKTCLLTGAYHFHRFKTKAKDQATAFIDTVRSTFSSLSLPPMLDIEDITETLSPAQCEDDIQTWLKLVENELRVKPIIYTGRWYWTDPKRLNNSRKFKSYRLWHAQYSDTYLPMYGGWQYPDIWQYSDKGLVAGLAGANASIDLNYFMGDINSLWSLTQKPTLSSSNKYNPKVEALQFILNKKGFKAGIQDGLFGSGTLKALNNWQVQNGLDKQNNVTPRQWEALFDLLIMT